MTAYSPERFPEELVYSLVARLRMGMGRAPGGRLVTSSPGRAPAVATVDLPGHLDAVAATLGREGPDLVRRHTLLPYYSAFQPDPVRLSVSAAMRSGPTAGVHLRLGLTTFSIRPDRTLRFCVDCRAAQIRRTGEAAWLRTHQMPGSVVCAVHRTPLLSSEIGTTVTGRHAYVRLAGGTNGRPLAEGMTQSSADLLARIAAAQAALCDGRSAARDLCDWKDHYRERLAAVGLMRSRRKVDLPRLVGCLGEMYGGVLRYLPEPCARFDRWPLAMVREHRKATHPLLHVMMGLMLDDAAPRVDPFGPAPWPCLNVLAEHHGQHRVASLDRYRNRDAVVGVFTCECGHSYTRCLRDDGALDPPRVRNAGPLLEPALRDLVGSGVPLRAVARAVGLDPKTVIREANGMGIDVPWRTRPSGRPRRPAGNAPRAARPRSAVPRMPAPSRIDWVAVDERTAGELRVIADRVRSASPVRRLTIAALELGLGRPGWLQKRWSKLPRTRREALRLSETVADFQRRRVAEVVRSDPDEVRTWVILRRAGLRGRELPLVGDLLPDRLYFTV